MGQQTGLRLTVVTVLFFNEVLFSYFYFFVKVHFAAISALKVALGASHTFFATRLISVMPKQLDWADSRLFDSSECRHWGHADCDNIFAENALTISTLKLLVRTRV